MRKKLLLATSLLCFMFSCGGNPSEDDAKKALSEVFNGLGRVEEVEKFNGWKENNGEAYVMEVKYKLRLTPKNKADLEKSSHNLFASLIAQPLIRICTKDGKIQDECVGKAKLKFIKTENGWKLVKNESDLFSNQ